MTTRAPSPDPGASGPPPQLLAELRELVGRDPWLSEVGGRAGEPSDLHVQVLRPGPSAYFAVRVPVPGRAGVVWVSRLPGAHVPSTDADVAALDRIGVRRVFCLVPEAAVAGLHGAHRYLARARETFGERLHVVPILDHQVPAEDALFEDMVGRADDALARGEHVLVHCVGGCGRTGMFVASLLVRGGMPAREAIEHFRRHRRCGPETPEQMAFVVRYEHRLAARRAAVDVPPPTVRLVVDAAGEPVKLAKGGLATIYVGRLRVPGCAPRRVAVKRFVYPVDDAAAARMQRTIDALRAAGVRLPRMVMLRLAGGPWVQVAPLFGSRSRGSRFVQPSGFHRTLSEAERLFAADQLTRVANAAHLPSIDLFLLFGDREKGIVPIDLDLIVPEQDPTRLAAELVKRVIQLGADAAQRERLMEVVRRVGEPGLAARASALVADEASPYRRIFHVL